MNKIKKIYQILLKAYGKQGWWPLTNKHLVVEHSGRRPKTDSARLEVIFGAILTQNTNWYPNVTRALQQLKMGRKLTEKERRLVIEAEIIYKEIPENPKLLTKSKIFAQNTQWFPNVVKSIVQLNIGRILTDQEWEAIKKAEIAKGRISGNQTKQTDKATLTQNINWNNVEKALHNLSKDILIDVNKIVKINQKRLGGLIRPAGYYNQKAERLKIIANYILNNYQGNINHFFNYERLDNRGLKKHIQELRNELLKIKGIGPETADSIILYAAEKPVFVIDAYTKRIFGRLGFNANDYDAWQRLFMDTLSHDLDVFKEYHALIVEQAKRHCKKKAECDDCPISGFCRSRV